jgi:VCBS repeat-containing protein
MLVGDVSGTVYNDVNRNGINDPAENGLAGWTVFVDTNANGVLNAGERSAVTDINGRYAILGLTAGNATVVEVVPAGFAPTPGFTNSQVARIRNGRDQRASFPNVVLPATTGSITGTVFQDANENGTREPGEPGIGGWAMFLDTNGDAILNPGEPSAVTTADGTYRFPTVAVGSATVFEIPADGMRPTTGGGLFPIVGGFDRRTVSVAAGVASRADFGNLVPQVGTIQGTVRNDLDGDGAAGLGEPALAGRTVYVDLNGNGVADGGEPSRITDASGGYSFADIHTGTYTVAEDVPAGWSSSLGAPSARTVPVTLGSISTVDFFDLVPALGSISGTVFNDADGNGARSADEAGVSGWQVFLDTNGNRALDVGEQSTLTDPSGAYAFAAVPYGPISVGEVVPADWVTTNPLSASRSFLQLNGGITTGIDFGNRERIGTITGTVWNDANGSGFRDPTEAGLAGAMVYLDTDRDGVQSPSEPTAVTSADGTYSFGRVPAGPQVVREVLDAGWITTIGRSTVASVNVAVGGSHVVDFYRLQPVDGSVSGNVYGDLNSNGLVDPTDVPLSGWVVYADTNANALLDVGEPVATTDDAGAYTISGVPYGRTTIREVIQTGFASTNHPGGVVTISMLNGEARTGVVFTNFETASYTIGGTIFSDADNDGLRGPAERGLSGITVYVDINDNGVADPTEPSTVTSTDLYFTPTVNEVGTYSFAHLPRGTYVVREVLPAEMSGTAATATSRVVTVGPTSQTAVDFANRYRANEIHGVVFDDTDADHVRDAGEHLRPGVGVFIDSNRNNICDLDEPRSITGDDGTYHFYGLTPGAYVVREDATHGIQTFPQTTGGILWPAGTSNNTVGMVTPGVITASLAAGEVFSQAVSITLPGGGGVTTMVDVFLLFDDTGSFAGNSPLVRAAFPTIISTLQTALPGVDFGFGVGRFEEYANFASEYSSGRPFTLNQPIVASATPGFSLSIQSALDRMAPGYGGDGPETDIEALYQLVTGIGFDGNNNATISDSGPAGLASTQLTPGASGDVPSFASFVPDPTNNVLAPDGNIGGGGFRAGALPVILTATDTGFAYQPKGETVLTGTGGVALPVTDLTAASRGTTPYSAGAGFQETVTGLNALGALVIGLGTNAEPAFAPRQGLEALAKLTGAVNRSTTTIANGTIDPIDPGDPFYFQITTGFGATVASGITSAIENAVTNIAMDLTVRASDPRVKIVNHTGTIAGVGAGQTANFNIEFVGDGRPYRFDLQFVRAGTNVVVGSIPVVLGTPVIGDGYQFDDLYDGEIHTSSDFGHYVPNVAPSFTGGVDQTVSEDALPQSIAGWATNISPGPVNESAQVVSFLATTDNPGLFSVAPSISTDGTLTFTPAANAFGTALVTVQAQDNGGTGLLGVDTSAPQTFVITILPVSDAPTAVDDTYAGIDEALLAVVSPGVVANDVDADGDPLTARLVTAPTRGVVTFLGDGSFTYTPILGFRGTDRFTYVVNDGVLDSNVATVTVVLPHANTVPIVADDVYDAFEDTALVVAAPGITANDVDADADFLTARLVTGVAHGTLLLDATGAFVYTPALNYSGPDSFTYVVNDGFVDSLAATVSILVAPVNDAPLTVGDRYIVDEDSQFDSGLDTVLINDTDAEGDLLTAVLVTNPAHGVVAFAANGTFIYTPDPNYNGLDSFTYAATDGATASLPTTVTIQVVPVNDVPVATGEAYATNEDTTFGVAAPGLLANDFDIDGDPLRAILVSAPLRGTIALSPTGAFTYTPFLNFTGTDSFSYKVNDGSRDDSNTVTVTLTVNPINDAPVSVADAYTANQDKTLNVFAPGLLANDTDVDRDILTPVIATGPANGSVVLNADGSFSYTPNAGFSGSDSFTYRASDGLLLSAPATVSITVVIPAVKFFVADGTSGANFKYAVNGTTVGSNILSARRALGVASNPTGTTQWVVDGGGNIFVYSSTGGLLGQWTPRGAGRPEGVTVWGNDLWVVDPSGDRVYKFTGGALLRSGRVSPTSSFALNAANLDSKDLVTDGTSLWVVNDTVATDRVFKYTVAGALQGSWMLSTTNPSPTGITIDPDNVSNIWTVDASTDRVYQYDAAATRITGTQEPSTSFALASGNTNPQGIADPRPLIATSVPAAATAVDVAGTVSRLTADLFTAAGSAGSPSGLPASLPIRPAGDGPKAPSDATPRPTLVRTGTEASLEPIFIEVSALEKSNRIRHEVVDRQASRGDRRRPDGATIGSDDDRPPV